MGLKLVTPPASEPITLAQLKAHLQLDTSDQETYLTELIEDVRDMAQEYTGSALIAQTWDQTLDAFPCAEIELLKPPVTSITSVSYVDTTGATVVLSNTLYTLDSATFPGWLLPKFNTAWPSTQDQANAVTIRYVTGYANAAALPRSIRRWLLLNAGFLFAQREAMVLGGKVAEIPGRYMNSLLDPYRVFKA